MPLELALLSDLQHLNRFSLLLFGQRRLRPALPWPVEIPIRPAQIRSDHGQDQNRQHGQQKDQILFAALLSGLSVQTNNDLATNVPSPLRLNLGVRPQNRGVGCELLRSATRNFPRPLNGRSSDALPGDRSSAATPALLSPPSRSRAERAGCSPGECADADRPRKRPEPDTKFDNLCRRPAAACNRRSRRATLAARRPSSRVPASSFAPGSEPCRRTAEEPRGPRRLPPPSA